MDDTCPNCEGSKVIATICWVEGNVKHKKQVPCICTMGSEGAVREEGRKSRDNGTSVAKSNETGADGEAGEDAGNTDSGAPNTTSSGSRVG